MTLESSTDEAVDLSKVNSDVLDLLKSHLNYEDDFVRALSFHYSAFLRMVEAGKQGGSSFKDTEVERATRKAMADQLVIERMRQFPDANKRTNILDAYVALVSEFEAQPTWTISVLTKRFHLMLIAATGNTLSD
ncbi:MAG: hypothetical protein ACI9QC_000094 [Oceanicoccus sp.]|jgi:hypothetical protein